MKHVGAHVSAEGGVANAPKNAIDIQARAFALFVKPQRQWIARSLDNDEVTTFKDNLARAEISPRMVLPHASYLINVASPDVAAREKSIQSLVGEMRRCSALGLPYLNLHPGSYLKEGTRDEATCRIANSLNTALQLVSDVSLVIENTAGQGSYMGVSFEELALIFERVADKNRVGICLDTAHLHGAGFDITTLNGYKNVFDTFAKVVGFDKLRGLHLNDTKTLLGSHVDRHAPIGEGVLGWETFRRIMTDERFDDMPLILETPDDERWADEIRRLYEL